MGDADIISFGIHKMFGVGVIFASSNLTIFLGCFSLDIDFGQEKTPHNKWVAFYNHW